MHDLPMFMLETINKFLSAEFLSIIIHSSLFLLGLDSSLLVCFIVLLIWQLNVLMLGSTITINTSDTIIGIIKLLNLIFNRHVVRLRVIQLLL